MPQCSVEKYLKQQGTLVTADTRVVALWHESPRQSSLREEVAPDNGLVPVRALYSMVSTGTERLVASGTLDASFQENMQVQHQQGDFALPIKYGYSLVGCIPSRQLVHLMHPHQSVAFAQPKQLYYLPEDMSPQVATLISNMETIVNAMWDAELFFALSKLQNQKVAIVGFGNIGALLAVTLRKCYGVRPVIIESDNWRREKAEQLGFVVTNDNIKFNLLFHSTGQQNGLGWCLKNAETEGIIIDLSWYGQQAISLSLGREFHYQRLRIISSQVSHIPGHKPNENYLSRKQYCTELLLDPIYQQLISHKVPFADAPVFFNQLRNRQLPGGLIWLLDYAVSNP